MVHSRGLYLSLFGGVVFFVSLSAMIFLPDGGPAIGMMAGGACIWIGFLWTLASFYLPASGPSK